jgi:2-dehydro-3-deoxygluconokinase
LDGIQHLHLTGIALGISPAARDATLTLLDAALTAGLSISFDPNLRLNLWPDREEMRG